MGRVALSLNPITWEAEAEGSLRVPGHPVLHSLKKLFVRGMAISITFVKCAVIKNTLELGMMAHTYNSGT